MGTPVPVGRSDLWRLVVVFILLVVALPWVFADLGFCIGDVPGLGALFLSREFRPPEPEMPAVHLGHHHGVDGVAFVVSALVLSRTLRKVSGVRLRALLTFVLALMLSHGFAVAVNDSWHEQVVKRGWTSVDISLSVLWPAVTWDWGIVLVATMVLYLGIMRSLRDPNRTSVMERVAA